MSVPVRDMQMELDARVKRLRDLCDALQERLTETYTLGPDGPVIHDGRAYCNIRALLPRLQGTEQHFKAAMQGLICFDDLVRRAETLKAGARRA